MILKRYSHLLKTTVHAARSYFSFAPQERIVFRALGPRPYRQSLRELVCAPADGTVVLVHNYDEPHDLEDTALSA